MPAARTAIALLACTAFVGAQEQRGDRYQGQPTEYWVERLQQGDLGGRRKAVYALWHLADPKAAVPLAGALESADEYVRSTASKALAKLGEGAQAALAKIAELVNHEREAVRREAATLCYRLGPLAARIVDPLTRALASKDPLVRANAAAALGNAGAAASSAVPRLMAQLNDEDKDARNWAAYAVARIDPLVALKDPRTFVRVSALKALGGDSRSLVSPEVIEVVLRLVRDETEEVRVWATNVLGTALLSKKRLFPAGTTKTERILLDAYPKEESVAVRAWIVYALGRLPAISETTVPWLIENLEASDSNLRVNSLSALHQLGPKAKAAVPAILRALKHPDLDRRSGAALVLGNFDVRTQEVVGALTAALADEESRVRVYAAGSLARLGAISAVPALVRALEEGPDDYAREHVAAALGSLGPKAEKAAPALEKALARGGQVAVRAAYALAAIQDQPPAAAWNTLLATALGKDEIPRNVANSYLFSLKARAAPLVARLTAALKSGDPVQRARAARALGSIGPAARVSLPTLRGLLDDPDPTVRDVVGIAVERIQKG